MSTHLWTSESVSKGHPDKVADQIADAILDANIAIDPNVRSAVEVTITRDRSGDDVVILTGEIGSKEDYEINFDSVVKDTLRRIGYSTAKSGFNVDDCIIYNHIRPQSIEIANAVVGQNEIGAGDQGFMFGYAEKNDLTDHMPIAHYLARQIVDQVSEVDGYYPDAKSQVTLELEGEDLVGIDTVLLSVCSPERFSIDDVRYFWEDKIRGLLTRLGFNSNLENTKYLINPAGAWHLGGPASDTGLSGRKIIVDNYGPDCPHGGGSFSGKDPTKVDRSAAYAARYLAKAIIIAGLAKKCQIQLAYAIGVAEPVSVFINTFNTGEISTKGLVELVKSTTDLRPAALIEELNLQQPIYEETSRDGHFFGDFSWEMKAKEKSKELLKNVL